LKFCEALGDRNITEFNYRYAAGPKRASFVGVTLHRGAAEAAEISAQLEAQGYPVLDLSATSSRSCTFAISSGAKCRGSKPSSCTASSSPSGPGALHNFLQAIGDLWNISLFHYRNHGSDYGRVLAGVQVPESDRAEFAQHLKKLGYS
jgi:threonine dehydratase